MSVFSSPIVLLAAVGFAFGAFARNSGATEGCIVYEGKEGPGKGKRQQHKHRAAQDEQQQFLKAQAPAGLLDAGEQELHGRPGNGAISAAEKEVQPPRLL